MALPKISVHVPRPMCAIEEIHRTGFSALCLVRTSTFVSVKWPPSVPASLTGLLVWGLIHILLMIDGSLVFRVLQISQHRENVVVMIRKSLNVTFLPFWLPSLSLLSLRLMTPVRLLERFNVSRICLSLVRRIMMWMCLRLFLLRNIGR